MKENIKLPKSALALYVKLFCKKKENMRSSSKHKLLRATSSWLSLSEKERQRFVDKLRVLQLSYKKTFANYLKDAELFMKKRCPKQSPDNVTLNSTIEQNSDIEDVPSQPNDNICMNADYEQQQSLKDTHEVLYPKLPEPVPPNIKNAKELFELIQNNKESNSCWSTLTAPEKRRYQNAFLSLKKEYIKRYREYLDCLSSEELFSHYKKFT